MGKFTVTKIVPKMQQDYATGENVPAQFKGDTGDVLFGWFTTLKGEDQKETVAQCWFKKGEEFKEGQEVEGELVPASDKSGQQYYKFKKMSGGFSGRKGGSFAPRDYRKEAIASASTMTMSYAKDIVVALIASGAIKKAEAAQADVLNIAKALYEQAKGQIETDVAALPAAPAQTETKPAEAQPAKSNEDSGEEAPHPADAGSEGSPINPDEDINIDDIPF